MGAKDPHAAMDLRGRPKGREQVKGFDKTNGLRDLIDKQVKGFDRLTGQGI